MGLSQEEIKAAEEMHEFVCEYERQRPWIWISVLAIPTTLVVSIVTLLAASRSPVAGDKVVSGILFGFILGCILGGTISYLPGRNRYRDSRALLNLLEREHRDELPWIARKREESEIEKHLAALKRLEQELVNKPVAP